MINTVIFDYNGTLVNDTEKMAKLFSNALEKAGLEPITLTEFSNNFALPVSRFASNLGLNKTQKKEVVQNFINEWKKYKDKTPLYENTKEILKYLRDNDIKIIILTAYLPEPLEKELKENKINQFIDEIICDGNKLGAITNFFKDNNLKPGESLCVGDANFDIECGKNSGMITVGFTGGYVPKERLAKSEPDYLIDNLSEIKNIIEN